MKVVSHLVVHERFSEQVPPRVGAVFKVEYEFPPDAMAPRSSVLAVQGVVLGVYQWSEPTTDAEREDIAIQRAQQEAVRRQVRAQQGGLLFPGGGS